jgi:hypothetical protein
LLKSPAYFLDPPPLPPEDLEPPQEKPVSIQSFRMTIIWCSVNKRKVEIV